MRCALLLLAACTDEPEMPWDFEGTPPRHALVIVLDTTRADLLDEVQAPNVDGLIAAGAAVERAWAGSTWTAPSVISLFTGMSLREHGWDLPTGRLGRYPPLPRVPLLAEVLKKAGFSTYGLHANPYLAEALGFDRGFDEYHQSADPAIPGQLQKHVQQRWGDGRRHFAYVHLIGPHSPLKPSAGAAARWKVDVSRADPKHGFLIGAAKRDKTGPGREIYATAYRAVLEDTDARVGEILAALGPHRKDTLVVLTADHGELLGEHERMGHGSHVWEPLAHVPFIVDHPGIPGEDEILPAALSNVALADVLTRSLDVEHHWPVEVTAPLPLISQREGRMALSPDGRLRAIWDEDLGPAVQVFDLMTDPQESRPLEDPAQARAMIEARLDWEQQTPKGALTAEIEVLPAETVQALEALGYREGP